MTRSILTRGQLDALLESSKLLNSTLETQELLRHITDCARRISGGERTTLYHLDEERGALWTEVISGPAIGAFWIPLGKGIVGSVAATGRSSMLKDAYRSPRFDRSFDKKTGFRTRSLLTVPFHGRNGKVLGVIQALNHRSKGFFQDRDRVALEQLGDYAALALENARVVEDLKQKRQMEDDLIAACRIQQNLLPRSLPQIEGVDLEAIYIPCQQVGGDCYDAFQIADGRCGFSLGDISGKGLTAAMMMANLQALFRVEARRGNSPENVLREMSALFHETTEAHQFATFFYGILDPSSGHLRYCSAGHEPMIILRSGGKVEVSPPGGLPLGILADIEYSLQEIHLQPGDSCMVYSDGITEQHDAGGEQFGMDRLLASVSFCSGLSARCLAGRVEKDIREFAGSHPADDDFTMLALRLASSPGGQQQG